MCHCQTNKLSLPLREKKESIRLGEKLVVPDGDADPARRNGTCLGPLYRIVPVYLWHMQPGWWPLQLISNLLGFGLFFPPSVRNNF